MGKKNVFTIGLPFKGKVTSIGINYGVDDVYCASDLVEAEWLPGACTLSFKEDLILDDYFPFKGKAYCEDIFLSHYRLRAHLRLWIATKVKIFTDQTPPEYNIKSVRKIISIRRYYLTLTHGPKWRLLLYEFFCILRSWVYSFSGKKAA